MVYTQNDAYDMLHETLNPIHKLNYLYEMKFFADTQRGSRDVKSQHTTWRTPLGLQISFDLTDDYLFEQLFCATQILPTFSGKDIFHLMCKIFSSLCKIFRLIIYCVDLIFLGNLVNEVGYNYSTKMR